MEGNAPNESRSDSVIRFTCAFCSHHIVVPAADAGKKGKCPKCRRLVIVPQPPLASPSPPSQHDDTPIRLRRDSPLPAAGDHPVYSTSQRPHRDSPETLEYAKTQAVGKPPQPETRPHTLMDVFAYPFSLSGAIHFLIFWLGPPLLMLLYVVAGSFCCYGAVLSLFLSIMLSGYFLYYLAFCIIESAKGEHYAPDVSLDDVPGAGDLIRRLVLLLGSTALCFAPATTYAVYFYMWQTDAPLAWRTDPVYWILYAAGVLLFPMFLLAIALLDSVTALNPILIISSIASAFLPYCLLVVLFSCAGLLISMIPPWLWGTGILVGAVDVYLLFLGAHLLGLFYRRYENKLNWEVKL